MAHDLVHVENGKARLYPHPGQQAAWDSTTRFMFIIAGSQSGKTSFLPWMLAREIDRCGEGDYLAVTSTYDLYKLKLLPEMRQVFCNTLPGWDWHPSDRLLYNAAQKTRIILRSANAPEGLESATVKAAMLDECGQDTFRLESWEAVQRRLSLSQGRVIAGTTPYNMGWLKTEVYDRWRAGDPNFQVIQFKSIMNPHFPAAEYERMKGILPDWKFKMFYDGEFSRPAGMIYEDYDETVHLVEPIEIPPQWPRYIGIDPGAVHTAGIGLAEDPEKKVYYLYWEYLEGGRTTSQHVGAVKSVTEGINVVGWAGGAKSEEQFRWDWQAAGIPLREPFVVDVEAQIDRVIALFKTKRLFIFNTCRGVLDEVGTYSRELDERGQPTEKIKDKEKFHRLDALRYCVQLFSGGSWYIS